jgi:hypothetical protein
MSALIEDFVARSLRSVCEHCRKPISVYERFYRVTEPGRPARDWHEECWGRDLLTDGP